MRPPVWVTELAAAFWDRLGSPLPFPRNLEGDAQDWFSLSLHNVAGLSLAVVREWFCGQRLPAELLDADDRPLRGALVTKDGRAFVFVDAADPPAERRFTFAHELAHYLREAWHPRRQTQRALGVASVSEPTREQRFAAVLRGVRWPGTVHLMGRDDGRPTDPATAQAEDDADRLAWELLAPADDLDGVADLPATLVERFGLPSDAARRYAATLRPTRVVSPDLDRLRKFAPRPVGDGW